MSRFKQYLEAAKQREYDEKLVSELLTKYSNYGSPKIIKEIYLGLAGMKYDSSDIKGIFVDIIRTLEPALKKGASIKGSGYSYTPVGKTLTAWKTSDGGRVKGKMLDIICNYAYDIDEALDYLSFDPEGMREELLTKARDQEDFETKQMRGDKYRKDEDD